MKRNDAKPNRPNTKTHAVSHVAFVIPCPLAQRAGITITQPNANACMGMRAGGALPSTFSAVGLPALAWSSLRRYAHRQMADTSAHARTQANTHAHA